MKITLPQNVCKIISDLESRGFEAFAVGGCVRDSILGRTPEDWDITTSARPEDVKAIYRRTIDTGIEHGTVKVMMGDEGYEVTTYRIDGEYSDMRHPDRVEFTVSLEEDLSRRDFTINAMAYNESRGLVDLFGGMEDLRSGVIRCVGESGERFNEDALRMFRAVRFAAQLDFSIDKDTAEAIRELSGNLKNISAERIQTELVKLITSSHPERIRDCYEMGITAAVLPEFDVMMKTPQNHMHHMYDVGEHTIKVMENVLPSKVMRLTALLHDVGKPATGTVDEEGYTHFKGHPNVGAEMAAGILRRLKFDNDSIHKVKTLIKWHDVRPDATEKNIRRLLSKVGEDLFPLLLDIKYGDILGQSDYMREEKLAILSDYRRCFEKIISEKQCFTIKDLAVDGHDLMDAGIPAGVEIGEKLKSLLEIVLEDPARNKKDVLLSYIKEGLC
ncbi:MAG: CCA tRNA nucleotidyltransferase [Lachnospiraceae bacterium]|nr:CCA tRNA nucleotidyltransferase [Lachnospiraceae bacterium]